MGKMPKQVVILGLVSFFTDFASEMLYPVTPIFMTSVLGASMALIGLIEGIAEITAGLLKGYFGKLSDQIQKRSIFVQAGYSLSGLVKSLPGIFTTVPIVIISRVFDRIGKGIRTAPRDALLSFHSKNNSGAVFGFHRSMDTFGAVTGPIIAICLLYFFPGKYSWIYLFAIIPSVAAIFFTSLVKDIKIDKKSSAKTNFKTFWNLAPKEYKTLLIIFTLFSVANSSDVFLILRSKTISNSDTIALFGYVFYNLIYALSSFPIGKISDKIGKKKIMIIGIFIYAVVYLGFAVNTQMYFVWPLFAMYGIYAASTEGISKAWISDIVSSDYKGSAIGLFTMCSGFGVLIGSTLAGVLWDAYSSNVPFYFSSILAAITVILLLKTK